MERAEVVIGLVRPRKVEDLAKCLWRSFANTCAAMLT